jgi:tRNA1Val (adenine37-N6)-methyltransferase
MQDRRLIFHFRDFSMRQAPSGQRINTDSCTFGDALRPAGEIGQEPARCLDIGCGTGLLAIMMAAKFPDSQVTGIEPVADLAEIARENAAASPWHRRIEIHTSRLDELAASSKLQFDLIACNPPFFSSGPKSEDPIRAMARHDGTLGMNETVDGIATLLTPAGTAWILCPAKDQDAWISRFAGYDLNIAGIKVFTDHPEARPHACALGFMRIEINRAPLREEIFYRTGPGGDASPWMKDYRRRWHP